ncbi:glycosyltransferase family 39 protein [Sphingomonas echinoides]|uniref:glycosyltransferase family 39 protein n=1 Tax=Sphingomonas echinoides TaxID=59803 RepID=UPI0024135F34|nr:glycosyltransferase family 39 protein [Sphingomonas echinoides]
MSAASTERAAGVRTKQARSRHGLAAFAVILLLAAVLRFALSDYALWFDEYASLFFAHQPFARLWSAWMIRETNPPLFYSILRGWLLLVGPMDRITLRVPTIMASLLLIAVSYFALARHYGERGAAAGALLLAVSAQQIAYAHQVRGYSMLAVALTISFFSLMRIVAANESNTRQRVTSWVGYVGGAIAAVYLHGTAVLWVPVATLALMAVDRRFVPFVGRDWLRLAFADLVIVIGSGWALYIIYWQTRVPNPNLSWLHFPGVPISLELFWASTLLMRDPWGMQSIAATVVFGAALFGITRTIHRKATQLAAACWIGMLTLFILFSLKQPVIVERTLVWIAIFPVTLACAWLSTLRSLRTFLLAAGVLTGLTAANLWATQSGFELEDWQGAVAQVLKDPRGVIVVSGEGGAVIADEACKFADQRETCRVPIITLSGQTNNAWAKGYAPAIPTVGKDRLDLPKTSNLYMIQRFAEQPLSDLQAAGLLPDDGENLDFFVGPFGPPLVSRLERSACVEGRVLNPSCSAPRDR